MAVEPDVEPAAESADEQAAEPAVEAALSFEEQYEKAETLYRHNPEYRRIFFDLLRFCNDTPQLLSVLEERVSRQPGYEHLRQPPYFPISWLAEYYALEECYVDADGVAYTSQEISELSEDEFDDLIVEYAYITTDVGRELLEEYDPTIQIRHLLDEEPERAQVYIDILVFLQDKHGFADVDHLIRGRKELAETSTTDKVVTPTMFIEKLSSVGGIFYDEGWQTTEEGGEFIRGMNNEN